MNSYQSAISALDPEKQSEITRHPLYPVVKFLLEKCDNATEKFGVTHVSLNSIDSEIEAMVRKCLKDGPLTYPNQEIHNMVILTLQVLRIHLLELEKVGELCVDFTTRYINCLKQKMQTELLSAELLQESNEDGVSNTSGDSMFESCHQRQTSPDGPCSSTPLFSSHGHLGFNGYGAMTDVNGLPLTPSYPCRGNGTNMHPRRHSVPLATPNFESLSDAGNSSRKRGVLPKHATHVMRQWLFQHLMHPYPKESEKQIMASQTGLSLLQVNNWFINARRRVLQPIMDRSNPPPAAGSAANPSSKSGRSKHKKTSSQGGGATGSTGNGAVNRFWPEKLRSTTLAAASVDSSAASSSSSSTGSLSERQQSHQQNTPLTGGYAGVNENANLAQLAKDEQVWMLATAAGRELVTDSAH